MPVHPIIVHFPIALSFLAPVIYLILFYYHRKHRTAVWQWAAILSMVIVASTYAALFTGDQEEDNIEDILEKKITEVQGTEKTGSPVVMTPEEKEKMEHELEEHEEAAETFFIFTVLAAILAVASVKKGKQQIWLQIVFLAAQPFLLYSLYTAAEHGGELVYKYHASKVRQGNIEIKAGD